MFDPIVRILERMRQEEGALPRLAAPVDERPPRALVSPPPVPRRQVGRRVSNDRGGGGA
jgi:hypothetical protein